MVIIESEHWGNYDEEAAGHAVTRSGNATDFESVMEQGRAFYKARDFEAARIKFQEAVREGEVAGLSTDLLLPAVSNIAACSLRMEDYEGVLTSTEYVLVSQLQQLYRYTLLFSHGVPSWLWCFVLRVRASSSPTVAKSALPPAMCNKATRCCRRTRQFLRRSVLRFNRHSQPGCLYDATAKYLAP